MHSAAASEEFNPWHRLGGAGIALAGALAIWGLITTGGESSIVDTETQFPTIRATLTALGDLVTDGGVGPIDGTLWESIARTVGRFLAALIGGLAVGSALGQAGRNAWARGVLDPLASFFRMVAPAVFFGLVILWRGIGNESIIWVALLSTAWVVAGRTSDALATSARPDAGSLQVQSIEVLRLAALVAWWATLTAESFGGRDGLAAGALAATRFLRLDVMVAYIIVIGVIGLLVDTAIRAIGWAIRNA